MRMPFRTYPKTSIVSRSRNRIAQAFGWKDTLSRWPRILPDEAPPLRSGLFSADQMAQHGKVFAASHQLAAGSSPDLLLARLAENEMALTRICNLLT